VLRRRLARTVGATLVTLLALLPSNASSAASSGELLDALVGAYPDRLAGHDAVRIYWRDGTVMPVSDGIAFKSYEQLLTNSSILDQLSLSYPRGALGQPPGVNEDPGRFRNEPFFLKMYGDCRKGEVEQQLVPIAWLPHGWGQTVRVTRINGVAERLKAVAGEIDALPDAVRRAAYPISGVLSCRPVPDTGRLSMHAFAAAIDLNIAVSDYWLWQQSSAAGAIRYRNRMPPEIVDIFERYGFIWGGKWYHYDTMHFEYRPELLAVSGRP
jgi:hypothetical protein